MNKSEQLYQSLKEQLIASTPGSSFRTVRSIMDDFGVSQATVANATRRLTREGLLCKHGRRCMEVSPTVLRYRKGAKPVYCLAVPRWPSEYYNMVEMCFLESAEQLGYEYEVLYFDWRQHVPRKLEQPKVDGLIVIPAPRLMVSEDTNALNSLGIPYVIFGGHLPGMALNSVSNDEAYTGAVAAHHFCELGHRKLAVLFSEPVSEGLLARTKGFRQFAELRGCSVEEINCGISAGEDAVEKSYLYLRKLWAERKPDFTALFVLSDSTAFSVYQACYECGITIPDQLSVVVAGEAWNLAYRAPALTSIGINHVRLIEEAVRLLKNPDPERFEHVQLKAELTIRESTRRIAPPLS